MLTKDEFKEIFVCDDEQVGLWIRQGLPHEKEMVAGKRRTYKLKFNKELCHKWFRGGR